jgi:nucleoside triphosphate pyrophosphatase
MRLILASTSPRRREILALLGLPFEVIAPEFEEQVSIDSPIERETLDFAVRKARSVIGSNPRSIVIGSDTMIDLDGVKIGKPSDRRDAAQILQSLSGKSHRIYTSVAILDDCGGAGFTAVENVLVEMRQYSDDEVEAYLSCGESHDKAGAYSIQGQGSRLIKSISGDYLAAVGMPLKPIADYLKSRGVAIPIDVDKLYSARSYLNWREFA